MWKGGLLPPYERIKPSLKKMPPGAWAIHHITTQMLKSEKSFNESESLKLLQKHNSHSTTLIAHNSSFDLPMLEREGFIFQGEVIDTLRCSRHLMGDCEQFSLQFLRYETKLYMDEDKLAKELNISLTPHHALSDAFHVKLLFDYLLEIENINKLKELSSKKVLLSKFNFGKYNGRYIEEIALQDRGYLEWMLNSSFETNEDLRYSLHYYLNIK